MSQLYVLLFAATFSYVYFPLLYVSVVFVRGGAAAGVV